MIRLFIGIEFDKNQKEALHGVSEKVQFSHASWISPKNIHLTLKFLGWSKEEDIGRIKNAVREVTRRYKPFYIKVGETGAFPVPRKARIVWVGVNGNLKSLTRLQEEIEDNLAELGFKKEKRPYHPHITLARLRTIEDASNFLNTEAPSFTMEVRELTLFQSKLSRKGADYSCLEKFSLKG